MFKGKVLQAFVDRHTKRYHARGTTYRAEDKGRMEQLADAGYIEFHPPELPPEDSQKAIDDGKPDEKKGGKGKKAAKE